MDQIRPIGPPERDIDPVYRVEKAHDQGGGREQPPRKRKQAPETQTQTQEDVGPVEGDDGHLHVDIRA
jgi:hypothetical protein